MKALHDELARMRDALHDVAMATGPLGSSEADAAMSRCFGSLARIEMAAGVREERTGVRPTTAPRFEMTYCSQCGSEQGPGDCGVSHCNRHREGWRGRKSA